MTAWVAMKASSSFVALMEDMTAIAALRVASSKRQRDWVATQKLTCPSLPRQTHPRVFGRMLPQLGPVRVGVTGRRKDHVRDQTDGLRTRGGRLR